MHYACCAASAVLSNSPVLFCPVQSVHFVCLRLKNPIREQIRRPFDSGLHFLFLFFARLRVCAAEEKKDKKKDEEEELGIFLGGVLRMERVQMWGGWGEMGSSGWVGAVEGRDGGRWEARSCCRFFFPCVSVSREVGGVGGC